MNSEKTNTHERLPADFIAAQTAERAGVIEVRLGAAAPVAFGKSGVSSESGAFAWPSSPPINSLVYDSREVSRGSLYFALPGLHVDGHDYIGDAVKRGAAAVVHQKELGEYLDGVLYIRVKDSRFAMSPLSAAFYDYPSRNMGIIGITGTEGKSTTVSLVYQLLKLAGKKTGFISTVQYADGDSETWNPEHQTTPEAVAIHRLLAQMRKNGVEYVVLESSSHGLSKKTNRLGDVNFDVGVLTKVTHEHLEFHGTFEQYRSDKAELFRTLDAFPAKNHLLNGKLIPSFGVVNADDPSADYFAAATVHKTYTFSTKGVEADLSIKMLESGAGGNWYEVFDASAGKTITLRDQLPGSFNAANVLAALLVVSNLLSVEVESLSGYVALLKPVRGRMAPVEKGQPFEVIVDYAHTPSSFEAVLPPLKERVAPNGGRLITLFGSPGERDTQKRFMQGEVAALHSDIVILADEDPRGEVPMAILEDIAKGCFAACGAVPMVQGETLFLIPDRPTAIRKAFSLAKKGDLVLLLGKGHENTIIYADKTIEYDEIKEAEAALAESGYR
ncbi:MAG: UDP-N-acetylmuramoyl-L-alanyl-D-glutamate--2,6-diaminopimelate ligase [Treponema sp.]|jgi:UDP-N-acetylmuramoyl-L-alanyl-D-glutamate--2,6-diaminopimelate ligase|nr:UDP-N-acetylmuramoyl-L-alanyl-D-glutamate--2,6-diaminopimelate ligase [Treponema sp.]